MYKIGVMRKDGDSIRYIRRERGGEGGESKVVSEEDGDRCSRENRDKERWK